MVRFAAPLTAVLLVVALHALGHVGEARFPVSNALQPGGDMRTGFLAGERPGSLVILLPPAAEKHGAIGIGNTSRKFPCRQGLGPDELVADSCVARGILEHGRICILIPLAAVAGIILRRCDETVGKLVVRAGGWPKSCRARHA